MNCTGTLRGTPATRITLASSSSDQAYVERRESLKANTVQGKAYLPQANVRLDIFEHPKAGIGKSSIPFRGRQTLDPRHDCLQWIDGSSLLTKERTVVGRDTIMGYDAVHVLYESGGRVWESWYAPKLACALIRQEVTFKENGRHSKNIMELQSVSNGPPNPSLFDFSRHVEGSPVDHLRAASKAAGKTEAELDRQFSAQPAYRKIHEEYLQQCAGK